MSDLKVSLQFHYIPTIIVVASLPISLVRDSPTSTALSFVGDDATSMFCKILTLRSSLQVQVRCPHVYQKVLYVEVCCVEVWYLPIFIYMIIVLVTKYIPKYNNKKIHGKIPCRKIGMCAPRVEMRTLRNNGLISEK